MKKSDILYYAGVGVLVVCILIVTIFKFVLRTGESFIIKDMDKITVTDLSSNEFRLNDLLKNSESSYCLVFDRNDCNSCVYRGIADLKNLKSKGKVCFGLAVDDSIEEVKGWSSHSGFSPFYVIKRVDFFEHIHCVKTPVFLKVRKGKIESYRYITAN